MIFANKKTKTTKNILNKKVYIASILTTTIYVVFFFISQFLQTEKKTVDYY